MIRARERTEKHEGEQVHGRDGQKTFLLRQAEDGAPIGDNFRKAGVGQATF